MNQHSQCQRKSTVTAMWILLIFMGLSVLQTPSPSQANPKGKTLAEKVISAQNLAQEKKWKQATDLLEPISENLSEKDLFNLSTYYKALKDFRSEIRHLNSLIDRRPERFIYHFHRGLSFSRIETKKKLEKKRLDQEAIASFQKAIGLQPTFQAAYKALLKVLDRQNNSVESRALLLEMISRFGEKPEHFTSLCRLYLQDGYIDDGVRVCHIAISKAPSVSDNYIFLARAQIQQGDPQGAKSTLNRSLKKFPNSALVQETNGSYYFNKKSYALASKYFKKAIQIDPNLVTSHTGLASSEFEQGNYDSALVSYVRACQLNRFQKKSYRQAITRLRGANQLQLSEKYEKQLYKCAQ